MEPETLVSKTIRIHAPAFQVWHALTRPELMRQWMSDAEMEITSSWKTGSPITVRGWMNGIHEFKGVILEFRPEQVLKYSSWTRISHLPDIPENYSFIEFKLNNESEDQTMLTLTHSNLIAKAAVEHANFYWNSALTVLKKLVEEPG